MLCYNELYNQVFDTSVRASKLVIISGFVGPAVIRDLSRLPYEVDLYVGMYGNNINKYLHKTLLELNKVNNINIYYTSFLVHTKCYVWLNNGAVERVLIGSANFSTSGLMTPNKEILGNLSDDSYAQLNSYISLIRNNSYPVVNYSGSLKEGATGENGISFVDEGTKTINETEVQISLLAGRGTNQPNILGITTNPGDVHAGAGLNWGFSNGLPKPNDAYIKIPKMQIYQNPLLFPPKDANTNEPIDVIWDDGTSMQMLLEGNQAISNVNYPKQISTYKSKAELGIYLRRRIGNKIGKDLVIPTDLKKEDFVPVCRYYKDKFITREMLEQYGRTSIGIKLIGDGTYYFDFSSNTKGVKPGNTSTSTSSINSFIPPRPPRPFIPPRPESRTTIGLKEVSEFLANNGKSTIEQISKRTGRQIPELRPILEGGVIGKLFSKNADGTYELVD